MVYETGDRTINGANGARDEGWLGPVVPGSARRIREEPLSALSNAVNGGLNTVSDGGGV